MRAAAWRLLLLATVVAGTCDIVYALTWTGVQGVPAQRLLQSVASGLLGLAAYDGGVATAALGLALHYAIVFVAAALYLVASRRSVGLRARPVVAGALFGLGIYLVMNFVLLPLSAFPHVLHFRFWTTASGVLVHMFGVGVPIALITRRAAHPAA